jgi:hypothetical protein
MLSQDPGEVHPILRDTVPYCSDIEFITVEFALAMKNEDPAAYLMMRIKDETDNRKVDLRILLNRMLRERAP